VQAAQAKPKFEPVKASFWRMVCDRPVYFLLLTFAGLGLRLFFYFKFPHVTGDTLVYGDIAKNWLDHGIFGLTHSEGVRPTLIRLPGYPAFLAACFVLFGKEHYNAVLLAQIVVDVITGFVVADVARRTVSPSAARIAFLLAVVCPFTANYTAAPLAETLSIFFAAVALDAAAAALIRQEQGSSVWSAWSGCGVAIACAILLRPDGGILLIALGLYLVSRMWRSPAERAPLIWAGALVLALSLAPLVPWTIRNWRDFHRLQPLVPQSASDPDEFTPDGFDKWVRTWAADYVSNEEVYWQVPDERIEISSLPTRAFDSPRQYAETQALVNDYNQALVVNPKLNEQFLLLAKQRIREAPLRYYLWLPVLRIADMWLRPRTEMLPLNSRWWEFADDTRSSVIAMLWGVLNLLFVAAAALGVILGPRPRYLGLMLLFVLLRSAFLGTLPNPEPRYTLECYPVVLVLGAAWISGWSKPKTSAA
jgi:hypothetical protein